MDFQRSFGKEAQWDVKNVCGLQGLEQGLPNPITKN